MSDANRHTNKSCKPHIEKNQKHNGMHA